MTPYRYIIQYLSDLRGLVQAKRGLRELEVYNTKFGAKVGRVTRVLSKNIQTSTKTVAGGASQHARTITRVFETASGQTYKYARTVTTAGGKVVQTTGKLAKTSKVLGKGLAAQTKGWAKLAVRAIAVIPIWMALRAAFMAVISSIRAVIRAQIDLDEGLARIETVVHGTAESIDRDMKLIKGVILDMAVKTRTPIKDLAEGFYFLKTANLETKEAVVAFEAALDVAVGTGVNMKEVSRGMAGMYHTMGESLGEALTITEKFRKIADVLTYTYATQDVQMSELIASYTKLAPYLTGLEDSFEDIVVMLGFLNTRMLRAGRTGRLTARSILQIQKNASKLAAIFRITFDPDQPLNLLKTIGLIYDRLQATTKITFEQGEALRRVFATRGAVAVRLLLASYEDLREELDLAGENLQGFAERMKAIRMDTIAAQTERLRNVMLVLSVDFFTGAMNAEDLTSAIEKLADWFESLRLDVQAAGYTVGWFANMISELAKISREMKPTKFELIFPVAGDVRRIITLVEGLRDVQAEGVFDIEKFVNKLIAAEGKIDKKREQQAKDRKKVLKDEEKREKLILNIEERRRAEVAYMLKSLETMGALGVEAARARLDSVKQVSTEEKYHMDLLKAQQNLIVATMNFRTTQEKKIADFRISILRAIKTSELDIIHWQMRQLELRRDSITAGRYLLDNLDLRLQRELKLIELEERHQQTYTDLVMMYMKAKDEEKKRIKRLMELMKYEPALVATRYFRDVFDRKVIEDYWRYFSKEQKESVAEIATRMERIIIPKFKEPIQKIILPTETIFRFGAALEEETRQAILRGISTAIPLEERIILAQKQILELFPRGIQVLPQFGDIHVHLPELAPEKIAEMSGEELIKILKTKKFQDIFDKLFWSEEEKGH